MAVHQTLYQIPNFSKKIHPQIFFDNNHFSNKTIQLHIRNSVSGEESLLEALPEPYVDDTLNVRLENNRQLNFSEYTLINIIINNGKSIIVAPVETASISNDIVTAGLKERGRVWNMRQNRRHPANIYICAEIEQDNHTLKGSLKEFSSGGFCIELDPDFFFSNEDFDIKKPFSVQLSGDKVFYSGLCTYVKTFLYENNRLIVLAINNEETLQKRRENRNPRVTLVPPPKIIFTHPFLNEEFEFELANISSAGFSLQLSTDESSLLPSLYIEDLYIVINSNIKLKCTARIEYCLRLDEKHVKYGFSILDMDMNTFNQLFAIICNADNPCVNLSPKIDLDSLWEFFFKSRFIYPKKYKMIESRRGEIRDIYSKLYQNGREIFSYVTYQENGKILGHCSMIRAYQRAWLVQHLAAISAENTNKVGIHMVSQLFNWAETMFKIPSTKMDYLMFYYRPDNKFTEYFFDGFYKEVNNSSILSQDTFAYLPCSLDSNKNFLPEEFKIEELNSEDYEILDKFYQKKSGGGFFLKSLGFGIKFDEEPLEEIYNRMELTRASKLYSLKENNKLKAVFIIDWSNIGINMSELLNCIKIFVIEMNLSWEYLKSAINAFGIIYPDDKISVMIYPTEYLNLNNIYTDRYYNLWMLESNYGYEYIDYLKQRSNPRLPSLLNKQ